MIESGYYIMKGLVFYGVRDLRYEDVPKPEITGARDVIVKVKAAGLCGSDNARYAKLGPHSPGIVWGHEFAGEVVAVGECVSKVRPGDRVAACPSIVCGRCYYCRMGNFAMCENLAAIGAFENGGFAEYCKMPAQNLVKMPDNVSYEDGALAEPSAVAVHALRKAHISGGDTIVVIGCGSIGEMVILWAKRLGVRVIAVDVQPGKLTKALAMGAEWAIDAHETNAVEELHKDGLGADIVFDCSGNAVSAAQALSLAKKGGQVIYVGIPYGDVPMPREHFEKIIRNELVVRGSFGVTSAPFPGREWDVIMEALGKGEVNVTDCISHREKLSQGPALFEQILKEPELFEKVMLFPEWE